MNYRGLGERDSTPGVHGSGPRGLCRSGLSAEMPALKTPVGGCGSGRGSGCYVLSAAGVSLLSQLPGRKQVNVNSENILENNRLSNAIIP